MSSVALTASGTVLNWTERGLVPDHMIRAGIRQLCRRRLKDISASDVQVSGALLEDFIADMRTAPVAPVPERANEQHYELPPEFFEQVLGARQKYSCAFWGVGTSELDQAEVDALTLTCARADIENGMDVLDLGCGWGSLSLWIAEHFPDCRVTAVSNSAEQGNYIRLKASRKGLQNLEVITQDMNTFRPDATFDRVVSLEMFEHMRNYGELFRRINSWLKPEGRFLMHIFCHRSTPYEFVDEGPSDWMSRYFFTGGIMPSDDLPLRFQEHLKLQQRFRWSGQHYQKTANAWVRNMDDNRAGIMPILEDTYGSDRAEQWFQRWRIFFMACAELFGFNEGREWYVSHYLFRRGESGSEQT